MQSVMLTVPGRKTDIKDAQWLCQLLEAGLLRASFVPPKPIRTLRNLTRYRKTQINDRSREAARLHKMLEDAGIKLATVRDRHHGQVRPRHDQRASGRHDRSRGAR
jgi:transposase